MKTKNAMVYGAALLLVMVMTSYGQTTAASPTSGELTGTVKEYTPGTSLVLETLAPNGPVQFKLSKKVSFTDTDGKSIEAAGLTTNRHVRVHYSQIGGDYVADKITLIPN